MVASYRQRVGKTGEHRLAVMLNTGGFAVKDFSRTADITAVGFHDGLVAEADTDNR